ncbi:hypothetical protein FACUT_6834 [Fusarium acutatum]|uniref:DUF7730 domain-containing protein n=1 Tax=Fusarium acutatum TaxID=78861 RepID=A0A8H4NI48_9HYPO|nr:hypothetical protein FACUT_6834 [Fusarium acutatum]
MSIALDIVTAAHEALEFVAGPMPDKTTQKERLNRWKSIYKPITSEKSQLFLRSLKKIIPADQGDPAHGYVYGLRDLPNAKLKLMCGEKAGEGKWKWYSVTDNLPGEHVPISGMEQYKKIAFDYPGTWVFDHRLIWADNEDEKPILCQDGWLGAVLWDKDIVVFCDEMFQAQAKAIKSPREWKRSGIVAGAQLNDYHQNHLSVIMVHELCHWFGGAVRDAQGIPGPIIDDQTAINGSGRTIYKINHERALEVEPSRIKAAERGYQRVVALLTWCSDGSEKVFTLAMCKDERNKNYCGPEKALKNADSLALFALAMYYDQWDCPRYPDAEEKEHERNERWEARVKELTLLPDPRPRALTPDSNPLSSSNTSTASASGPRPSYMETIDILYSTNTLILQGSRMINRLPQMLLPQRLATVTSLEVIWPFKTNYTPDQEYDDLDQDHLRSVLDLLLPSQFPALRRLYVQFHDGQECFLGISGLEVYEEIILRQLDSFAQRMTHLTECAFALPDYFFRMLHHEATEGTLECSDGSRAYYSRRSYQQVWRDFNGSMASVVLPYVDSYPKPPYQVVQEDEQAAGYWILEASDDKIMDSRDEPAHWCGSSSW